MASFQTIDLFDTSAMLNQFSYQTNFEQVMITL